MRVASTNAADGLRTVRYCSVSRRGWYDAGLPEEVISAVCGGDMDRVLFASSPLQVKDRCIVARYDAGRESLLVKRHIWGGFSRTVRMAFRESAPQQCARIGLHLHSLGVRTPRPRGMVDLRVGPWVHRSYLLTEYVAGASLYHHIRYETQTTDQLKHLAQQVAQIWQQLVTLGVSHNDFKPENFIVDDDSHVWIIDFEKTRLTGRPERQLQRQIADVLNFLHVRGWHCRPDARAIFAEAFLRVPSGQSLKSTGVERVAQGLSLSDSECDPGLSVVIVCRNPTDVVRLQSAIQSVRDIADEILIVQSKAQREFELLKRIEPLQRKPIDTDCRTLTCSLSVPRFVRYPWVLALQDNEYVTPFLAKELHQRICHNSDDIAYRMTRRLEYFGRAMTPQDNSPIRLIRSSKCNLQAEYGELAIKADEELVGRLSGTFHSNESASISTLVSRLDAQSSHNALRRLRAGERPRLVRTTIRKVFQFFKEVSGPSGFRSGWTGVQIAFLHSAFGWLEEAKLHQLSSEFGAGHADTASLDSEAALILAESTPVETIFRAA